MNDPAGETIRLFGARSDRRIMLITLFFAMAGSLLPLAFAGVAFAMGKMGSMDKAMPLYGMWIPLCFMTIPPIHFLCREISRLRSRIEELEKRGK